MTREFRSRIESNGSLSILESKLWFGPFSVNSLFWLEKYCQEKKLYEEGNLPKLAEFVWSDLADRSPKVWVIEAKQSIARKDEAASFDKNLEEWASKLANSIIVIAGIKSDAFNENIDFSDLPAYIKGEPLRSLDLNLSVVLNAEWATDVECQAIQIELRKKLSQQVTAWRLKKDSVWVLNREMAQIKGLTSGDVEP